MIRIEELEAVCKERDMQAMAAITVDRDGTVHVTTYGESQQKCQAIGEWAQGLHDHAITVVPFQTVFGWGNNGVPKEITEEQWGCLGSKISQSGKEYIEKYGKVSTSDGTAYTRRAV